MLVVGSLLVSTLIFVKGIKSGPTFRKCSWIKNITDIEQIGSHQYIILEDCLYYKLSSLAAKQFGNNALALLPPTKEGETKINVNIYQYDLHDAYLIFPEFEMKIIGSVDMSWTDYRLTWNPADWKVDTLTIKSASHLWVPQIDFSKFSSSLLRSGEYVNFLDIKSSWKGNVTARLEFVLYSTCRNDQRNHPTETLDCCTNFDFLLHNKLIQYSVKNYSDHIDKSFSRTRLRIKKFGLKTEINDQNDHRLSVCLSASRDFAVMKIQLFVPMVISAAIVIASPLFGTMQTQIFVKMFAILLQFICFQFLVEKTPVSASSSVVPKIYEFYEFTFALTLISLFITLILNSLSKLEKTIPPSHRLQLFASALNKYVCCGNGSSLGPLRTGHGEKDAEITKVLYNNDWKELFTALNNLVSIMLIVVYVVVSFAINM